jgi:hypothetical protein
MRGGEDDDLDVLDDLIRHLRPIEQLFRLLGEVGQDADAAELAHNTAEIGLALTARFRDHLEQSFRRGDANGGSA